MIAVPASQLTAYQRLFHVVRFPIMGVYAVLAHVAVSGELGLTFP